MATTKFGHVRNPRVTGAAVRASYARALASMRGAIKSADAVYLALLAADGVKGTEYDDARKVVDAFNDAQSLLYHVALKHGRTRARKNLR